mmetsp:Transcript_27283/g.71916  ORF Transcript_27283/g.71916 Transcript_27283/m.71916 type:complete len:374 (-) Transcript_27283:229-1350(-)
MTPRSPLVHLPTVGPLLRLASPRSTQQQSRNYVLSLDFGGRSLSRSRSIQHTSPSPLRGVHCETEIKDVSPRRSQSQFELRHHASPSQSRAIVWPSKLLADTRSRSSRSVETMVETMVNAPESPRSPQSAPPRAESPVRTGSARGPPLGSGILSPETPALRRPSERDRRGVPKVREPDNSGAKVRTFRSILCLGDSLTAGYINGNGAVPYSTRLKQRLKQLGARPTIVNAGVPGETTSQITQRLVKLLRQGGSFDLIPILAGTNDILTLASPDKIFEDIEHLHQLAWEANAKTIVMTLPHLCLPANPRCATFEENRRELNKRLLHFAKSNPHRAIFIDVATKIPRSTKHLWAKDGVHLSRQGYEEFGLLIAET